MIKHYIILLILIFNNHYCSWSQKQLKDKICYTVAAKNGLTVRSKPSITSIKLGKFSPGEHLEFIEDTKKFLSVMDNGVAIDGNWFKVKKMNHYWDHKSTLTGYVFSGYLLKNESAPYNPSDAITTHNSVLKFKNFNVNFYFYKIDDRYDNHNIVKNDTIYAYESAFNDLGDKLIYIEPKVKVDKVELFYTFKEKIWEYTTDTDDTKGYSWVGSSRFKKLSLDRQMFLFPKIEHEKIEASRELNLKLRDTFVHYPGEMGGIAATMSYNGKPCIHLITDVVLKIILHRSNGTKEVKYVSINLSYGC